jgi:hypothetical protein
MILDSPILIALDQVDDFDNVLDDDMEAGFFRYFPPSRFGDGLAEFLTSAREAPLSGTRWIAPSY